MFRFIFRLIAVFCLAIAVMFIVLDATRSLGVSQLVLTPLESSWRNFFPDTIEPLATWLTQSVHPFLNDPILVTFLTLPTFAVFAVLSAFFYVIAYKRKQHAVGFKKR